MQESRHYFNKLLLEKLLKINDSNPAFRFIQMLWATGIIHADNQGDIVDDFYEESESTWKRIKEIIKRYENN